ncbi:MAG: hypothetical protein R3E96_15420 [Planctomycetota bacterium]
MYRTALEHTESALGEKHWSMVSLLSSYGGYLSDGGSGTPPKRPYAGRCGSLLKAVVRRRTWP